MKDHVSEKTARYGAAVEQYTFDYEPIRGYPELRWTGKRPFRGTQYFPAQHKETHGEAVAGWMNRIYWGDNLQVMSHLLKEYRGKVRLIYIDPPFDSKADYKKKIELRGKSIANDHSAFEEKQYTDIWTNDEYLQYMYERLILMRELLAEDGSIYVHCDSIKGHYIKILIDEVFGMDSFISQIVWKRSDSHNDSGQGAKHYGSIHDMIFLFCKTNSYLWNNIYTPLPGSTAEKWYRHVDEQTGRRYNMADITGPGGEAKGNPVYEWKGIRRAWRFSKEHMEQLDTEGRIVYSGSGMPYQKRYLDESKGIPLQDWWDDIPMVRGIHKSEYLNYPTQKPEALLERIIQASSNPGDIVFDCFMGSGTTQAVAMKLGRRFLGADINLGAIQTTTKRLLGIVKDFEENGKTELPGIESGKPDKIFTGFEVYTVNNYEFFRNPVEARDLLLQALEVQPLPGNTVFDGEKDGMMVKILPVNRIATMADLNELISNLDYRGYEKEKKAHPNKPVERVQLVCMGHDPDLKAQFLEQLHKAGLDMEVEIVDILRDKQDLQFKRESEARIVIEKGHLVIEEYFPMNLLQKLSLEKEHVKRWRDLVDSVMIDFNYDGSVMEPQVTDIPEREETVKGKYKIPDNAGTIRVKITDLLSESLEVTVENR